MMKTYTLYSEEGCVDCNALKNTLNQQGIAYENRDINEEIEGLNPWRNRFEKNDLAKLKKAITSPQGMVIVTGPTGSGKTTTLYSILKTISNPSINILKDF